MLLFAFVPFNIRLLYACNALPHSCKYICFPLALFASISFCRSLCRFRFSLSLCFGTAVSRCCSQAFILHCALFTATFSVDFLTPDFLIGIQYFRNVHYAFKCELSALFPPSPSPNIFILYPFVQHALFIILRGRWPTVRELRKMLGNSMFRW